MESTNDQSNGMDEEHPEETKDNSVDTHNSGG